MGLTPACIKFAGPVADFFVGILPHEWSKGRGVLAKHEKPLALSDHTIIVGYGVNGKNLSRVLRKLNLPYVVIETNPFTVRKEAKRGHHILFGDASKTEILKHAQIEKARGMVVAISDAAASRRVAALARQINPALHIIVRTRYLLEVEPLYKLGVNEVVPEEFETSVEILSRVLRNYLVPQNDIEHCIAEVRGDGYEMLRTMSRRHSHAVGISGYLSGAELATFRIKQGSVLAGQSLSEGTIRSSSGATVMVIKRGEEVVPNPDPVWELQNDDILLLLGSAEQLAVAGKLFG
jgi:CPA2 family monovalent cation:H+ antiporter-2